MQRGALKVRPMHATPFLMFQGQARQALALYRTVFPDFEEVMLNEHGEGEQAGQVAQALVRIGGQDLRLFDSPPVHEFSFTPSISIFLDCDDEGQLRDIATRLSDNGAVLMPLDSYGFSTLYTWIVDPFGVSWQLNLP